MKFIDFTKLLDRFVVFEGDNEHRPIEDYCQTGLLVDAKGDPDAEIKTVITGVSLRKELILRAIKEKADAIIVHHPNGWWKSEKDKRLIGTHGEYVRLLMQHGICLYGYHLHLDRHFLVGNNYTIARLIQMHDPKQRLRFVTFMDGIGVRFTGCPTEETLASVFKYGYSVVGSKDAIKRLLDPSVDKHFAVCSGSGTSGLEEAKMLGTDVFITGEIHESTTIFAEENDMAVIYAGHHRTEVFCVQMLADYLSGAGQFSGIPRDIRFEGLAAKFIDIDNPI